MLLSIFKNLLEGGHSGLQRSGDARADCLIVCPYQFLVWAVAYGSQYFWIYAVFDATLTFANKRWSRSRSGLQP